MISSHSERDALRRAVMAAHDPGKTVTEIVRESGASRSYVYILLKKLGLPYESDKHRGRPGPRPDSVKARVLKAYSPFKTASQIADSAGAFRDQVYMILKAERLSYVKEARKSIWFKERGGPRSSTLLSRAKRHLRRRGYIVHLASVLGEMGGKYAVDNKRLTPAQMIAFAQKRGMAT